jgi:phospholipid/cholesterol/gamma-HCH transport system substrate-binding protein
MDKESLYKKLKNWNKKNNTLKINRKTYIGIFVFVIVTVFVWGYSFLKGHRIFQPKLYYYAVYEKVGGLIPSAKVTLKGFKVGQVEEVYFDTTDFKHLIVQIYMTEDIKIPKGSVAKIISADLMGTKEIQLDFSSSSNLHQPGDTLVAEVEKELMDEVNAQIAPLKFKAEELITSFDSVIVGVQSVFTDKTIENLKESFRALSQSLVQIETLTVDINQLFRNEKVHVQHFIKNLDSISTVLSNNSKNLNNMLNNLSNLSDSLAAAPIKQTIAATEKAMLDIQAITAKINSDNSSIGKLIHDPDLYNNLNASVKSLDSLLIDIKQYPGRYIHFSVFGGKD